MNWKKLVMTTTIASLLIVSIPMSLYAQKTNQQPQSSVEISSEAATYSDESDEPVTESEAADAEVLKANAGTSFIFNEGGITAKGDEEGYSIDGTVLNIEENGTYIVSGECPEGSIVIGKGLTAVTVILENLTLKSSTTAPLIVKKGSSVKLIITGSNVLTDAENPADEDVSDAFEGAAIKVKSGSVLEISGTGKLAVDGSSCKNGIKGAATATITLNGAALDISAANTALASDGRLVINNGSISINSADDGIKSEPDESDTESEGIVEINGGTISVNAKGDGIEATNDIIVNGGSITVSSGDDAIHSEKDAHVLNGTIKISAGDDAIHAEYELTIGASGTEGPDITVTNCNEGFEGGVVNLLSGSGTIKASDDGINAANKELGNNYTFAINIAGGEWTVDAGGDAIDSNRNVSITGGKTEAFGSTNAGNSALDYDGSCTLSGGSILAVGMSGMGQGVSSENCLTFNGVSVTSGTAIEIRDSSGNTVYTATGKKQANQVVFASDKLSSGASYTLYLNGKSAATATATAGQGSMMAGRGGMMPGQGGMMPGQGGQFQGQRGQIDGQNGQMPGMNDQFSDQNGQNNQQQTNIDQNSQSGQMPQQNGQFSGQGKQRFGKDGQFSDQNGQTDKNNQQQTNTGQNSQPGQIPGLNGQLPGQNDQADQLPDNKQDSLAAFIERLYQNILGRQSDANGLSSWIKALKNGASASQVVRGFFNSKEFQNMDLANSDYLKTLYSTLFNRDPDDGGYAAWLKYLDNGYDRDKILSGFCGSQEFANLCRTFGVQV